MKIWPVSDIHLEFGDWKLPEFKDNYPDICIMAGDIHPGLKGVEFAEYVGEKYSIPVVYICGNHEYYGKFKNRSLLGLNDEILFRSVNKDVYFLQNGIADFREKFDVMFIGATLWTDFALNGDQESAMRSAEHGMNDYRLIEHSKESNACISPAIILDEHRNSKAFIDQALAKHANSKCVVVTHHGPTKQSIHPDFNTIRDYDFNPCYSSDLSGLIEKHNAQLKLWIHGHTHKSLDYKVENTRVICNPRGYVRYEYNKEFIPNLIIEI